MNLGWECPNCDRVNAPDVKQCPCSEVRSRRVPAPPIPADWPEKQPWMPWPRPNDPYYEQYHPRWEWRPGTVIC